MAKYSSFLNNNSCREEGIRTLDSDAIGIHAFQACAFDHSATSLFDNWLKLEIKSKLKFRGKIKKYHLIIAHIQKFYLVCLKNLNSILGCFFRNQFWTFIVALRDFSENKFKVSWFISFTSIRRRT